MAFVPEALGKLRTLPKDEGWKTVGMQVLAAQGGDFRATFVAAEVSEACALLDGLVEEKQLANAAARKRAQTAVMQAEAEQKEAEDRLARTGQQDATDVARKDQEEGLKLLAKWAKGVKEKTK